MCGVVAVASWERPVVDADVDRALDAIAHRGPDGRGVWRSADGRVALGHVRLAVRDLEGGAQPIASEDGRVVASVNGELYGVGALRAELEGLGHRFRTGSDSEIVVHAWEAWRQGMLPRLRGELAFVLWDARARVLVAARDRFGVKPLVWAQRGDRLFVASRACALFALGVRPAWNHAALLQSASLQYAAPDATLFDGVHALAAGHVLVAREGDVRVARYWDLDYPVAPSDADETEALRAFRDAFDDAVRERLGADVPVAFQLSGGLDSSAVLASAARAATAPLDAFTVAFDDAAYDESSLAAATASHLGARLHVVQVHDRDVAGAFADAVVHAEGACVNAHAAAKLLLSRAVRRAGFKVALTGEGADEVLFGYAHLRGDREGGLAGVAASHAASLGLMLPDSEGLAMHAVERALGFVPTWVRAKAAFGKRVLALARRDVLARSGDEDAGHAMLRSFDVGAQLAGRGRVEQSAYLWTKLALEGYILRALGDGLEMASGVEGRLPFLDDVLFAQLRALPTALKIRDGVQKWILRASMRDRLPPAVTEREKHPFLAPPMGPRTLAMARDTLASASFASQPLFDPGRVRALLDSIDTMPPDARKVHDPVLYFALSIAVLHARFGMAS